MSAVTDMITAANVNAGGFVTLANGALAAAQGAVASVGFNEVTWTPIVNPLPPETDELPTLPNLEAAVLNLPNAPGNAPTLQDIGSINIGALPSNQAEKPTFNFGNTPSGLPDAPIKPEVNTDFIFPTVPSALSNDVPLLAEFATHVVPFKPELTIPTFSATDPTAPDAPPRDGELIMSRNYSSMSLVMAQNVEGYVTDYITRHSPNYFTQMTAIEAQLAKYLQGGTGLKPEVEDAIYSRARGKNDAEARRVRDQAMNDAAARGFTLPTGALMSAMQQARQAGADNNAKAASEIVVMQAEMEQKNLQFAVTTTNALHDTMRSAALAYANVLVSLNGQAMDYAKSVFANTIALYNASLAYYATQIEVLKTHVSIFQSRLQAELAKLEIFKGEISAYTALNEADKTKAAVYNARLSALNSIASAFKTQVDAKIAEASLQKLRLEMFQTEVQAFGSQAQAKNAEWSGYNARISGEESKAKIYSSELAAHNSELEAFKATLAAKSMELELIFKTNQSLSSNYDSTVKSYVAQVGAESSRSTAQNENNRMLLTEFQKQMAGFMAGVNLDIEKYKAENDAKVKNATGDLSAQVELAKAKSQYGATLAQLSNDGAQIYGQLASSAMAGMNSLAALTESV